MKKNGVFLSGRKEKAAILVHIERRYTFFMQEKNVIVVNVALMASNIIINFEMSRGFGYIFF